MSKNTYADSTLKSWTKDELIHQIRILENNCAVRLERLNNQAKLLKTWAPVVRCKDCQKWGERKADGYGYCCAFGTAMQENSFCSFGVKENNTPVADVAPVVHGRWTLECDPDDGNKPVCYHCSVCDSNGCHTSIRIAYKYCPNCGAKMDGGNT